MSVTKKLPILALWIVPPLFTAIHFFIYLDVSIRQEPEQRIQGDWAESDVVSRSDEFQWVDTSDLRMQKCQPGLAEQARSLLAGLDQTIRESSQLSIREEVNIGSRLINDLHDELGDELDGENEWESYFAHLARSMEHLMPRGMPLIIHHVRQAEVNAYSLPGGHILIYEGILNTMECEAQLMGVIAHEISHIKHRHAVAYYYLAKKLGIARNPAMLAGFLMRHSFSLDHEKQSDRDALKTILALGYSPYPFIETLQTLDHQDGGLGILSEFGDLLSTHPSSERRSCLAHNQLRFLIPAEQGDFYYLGRQNFQQRIAKSQAIF